MLTKEETKFKETEIGLIPEEWEVQELGNIIEFNPSRSLKKGTICNFVTMADLNPFQRQIAKSSIKEFSGGSKFRNGDTLLARITPCLENGKTAFVDILKNNIVAGGSTEFMVLAPFDSKVIDNTFIYYLFTSKVIRDMAIKSMVGSSGRQRVQEDMLAGYKIALPPLCEQKSIAEILSSLDEKIELNRRMNKTLEEIGKALFKRWFVDFEFPNENGKPYKSSGGKMLDSELGEIPEGWGVARIADVSKVVTGMTPSKDQSYYYGEQIPFVTPSDYKGYDVYISKTDRYLIGDCESKFDKILVPKNGIMVTCIGSDMGKVALSYKPSLTNQQINSVIFPKEHKCLSTYLYYELKAKYPILRSMADGGSTMPIVNKSSFENLLFINPAQNLVSSFYCLMILLFETVLDNSMQIEKLQKTKDLLLPKLISGRIRTLS